MQHAASRPHKTGKRDNENGGNARNCCSRLQCTDIQYQDAPPAASIVLLKLQQRSMGRFEIHKAQVRFSNLKNALTESGVPLYVSDSVCQKYNSHAAIHNEWLLKPRWARAPPCTHNPWRCATATQATCCPQNQGQKGRPTEA